MALDDLAPGFVTGLIGGVSSGLLGISPGGALVVLSVLLLGCDQHVAQGLSLVAQSLPTNLSRIERYREHGYRSPISWLGRQIAACLQARRYTGPASPI